MSPQTMKLVDFLVRKKPELEFLKSLWGPGTEQEEGYRTGPPGFIGWRNSFFGIDSGAPYTFKNMGPVFPLHKAKRHAVLGCFPA